jgi:uncharacterized membrane-anchored protein
MNQEARVALSKVPAVTIGFWIIKIFATTLGETGGDTVSMTMNFGYLVGTLIFTFVFVLAVSAQIKAKQFNPWLYWTTIIASTTVGTTLADFATRSLGIGYTGGSAVLLALLIISFYVWHRQLGRVNIGSITTPHSEFFYWMTIMFSQTLGTALGDWTADTAGLGYLGSAVIFSGLLLIVLFGYFYTNLSRVVLFWAAFVLTRPLGAVVGDFLDKPVAQGGLALSPYSATFALLAVILLSMVIFPQRAAKHAH